jgi:hypothetical protein
MPPLGHRRTTPFPLVGEDHHSSKLTQAEVLEIRRSKEGCTVLSERYGCSHTNVQLIRKKETWRHC